MRSECKRTGKIWGFKDPLTAILLPMWQEIFDELHLEPFYIQAVRHPGSVGRVFEQAIRFIFFPFADALA